MIDDLKEFKKPRWIKRHATALWFLHLSAGLLISSYLDDVRMQAFYNGLLCGSILYHSIYNWAYPRYGR